MGILKNWSDAFRCLGKSLTSQNSKKYLIVAGAKLTGFSLNPIEKLEKLADAENSGSYEAEKTAWEEFNNSLRPGSIAKDFGKAIGGATLGLPMKVVSGKLLGKDVVEGLEKISDTVQDVQDISKNS